LVGRHGEITEMGVDACFAREIDDHFHKNILLIKLVLALFVYWMIVSSESGNPGVTLAGRIPGIPVNILLAKFLPVHSLALSQVAWICSAR
jgi:hypothetical protein